MKNKLKAIAILMLAVLLLAGCGAKVSAHPNPTSEEAKVYITGTLDYEIVGDKINLHLTSDLLDGILVRMSIEDYAGNMIAEETLVKDGDNLKAGFDISGLSGQKIYGFATAAPTLYGKQPKEVKEVYGNKFNNVYSGMGENDMEIIMWGDDGVFIVFSTGSLVLE